MAKEWTQLEGRPFLLEAVPYRDLEPLLARLPAPDQARVEALKSKSRRVGGLPQPKREIREARASAPRFENGRLVLEGTQWAAVGRDTVRPGLPASEDEAKPGDAAPGTQP